MSGSAASAGGEPALLTVARVRRAHGIHGEVLVESLTDRPDTVLAPGRSLRLDAAADEEPGNVLIDEARPHKGGLILRLRGVESRSAAERLAGRELLTRLEDLEPLAEGEVFYHDLIGLAVVLAGDGSTVGTVRRIFEARPADLLEVRMGDRLVLVPFDRSIVRDVDLDGGRIVIDPPEGLLDL